MKVKVHRTPEEFDKITLKEFHNLWYNHALTLGQIAKMYGVDRDTVKAKKKAFNLTTFGCAMMTIAGGGKYKKYPIE